MGRPLDLSDLYAFERVSDPQLHPDGRRVAYVVTVGDEAADGYRSRVWLAGDGDARPFTHGARDAAPRWSPDGRTLAFLRSADGGPPALWALPLDGGDAREVVAGPVADFAWSPDGTRFALVRPTDLRGDTDDEAERRRRAVEPVAIDGLLYKGDGSGLLGSLRTHLFTVPVGGGTPEPLVTGDVQVRSPAWSPDGTRLAFLVNAHDDWDLDAATDVAVAGADATWSVVSDWSGMASVVRWVDDDRLLLAGAADVSRPGHDTLLTLDAAGGTPRPLLDGFDRNVMVGAPAYPGAPPQVAGDRIVFTARDGGCVHLFTVPLDGGTASKIVGGDDRVVSGCSAGAAGVAVVIADPRCLGDVVVCSTAGADERRVTRHNRFLDEVEWQVAQPRAFTAPDGTAVRGWLLGDDGGDPRPLLLDIHGGPHNAWGPALDDVHLYHQQLAADGWLVLTLNPRGSDGYGQDFFTAAHGAWGEADEDDFLSALDALVADGTADADRLAVTGYSYGGYMTAWLTARTPRFAAAVAGGCITDVRSFALAADVGVLAGSIEIGDLADRDRYLRLSPLTYVDDVTTPTLVLHGERDDRCPVSHAEAWFAALRRRRVPARMVLYPEASHLFIVNGRPSHRLDYNRRIVDWLSRHVP